MILNTSTEEHRLHDMKAHLREPQKPLSHPGQWWESSGQMGAPLAPASWCLAPAAEVVPCYVAANQREGQRLRLRVKDLKFEAHQKGERLTEMVTVFSSTKDGRA